MTASDAERYFEDFIPGLVQEFGPTVVGEAEIVEFARQYDPQPIHTDPAMGTQRPLRRPHRQRLAHRLLDDAHVRG